MDYLEGFLIGPIWSDTDYRSRRHYHAHVLLAALMGAAFASLLFIPEYVSKWMIVPWPLSLVLLIVLVVTTPLLSSIYYRIPVFIRPLILILYAAKYVLLFFVLAHIFLPMVTIDKERLPAMLFARMDDHISRSLNRFSGSGKVLMTVAGVVIGALWIIAEGLVVILVLIAVPLVAIGLLKGIRQLLDIGLYELIDRFIVKRNPVVSDEIPWLGKIDEGLAESSTAKVGTKRATLYEDDDDDRDDADTLFVTRKVPVLPAEEAPVPVRRTRRLHSVSRDGFVRRLVINDEEEKEFEPDALNANDEQEKEFDSDAFIDADRESRRSEPLDETTRFLETAQMETARQTEPDSYEGILETLESEGSEQQIDTEETDIFSHLDNNTINRQNKLRMIDKLRLSHDTPLEESLQNKDPLEQVLTQIDEEES